MNAAIAFPAQAGIQKHRHQNLLIAILSFLHRRESNARESGGSWWRRWLLPLYFILHGLGLSSSAWAVDAWQQTSGPAGSIQALAIAPTTPATLYASTHFLGGLFKSADGGDSWIEANNGLANSNTLSLAIDPVTPSTLYAGTSDGVFRSIDEGAHWLPASDGLTNNYVRSLAIAPTTPPVLYAGTDGGVFKSIDGGAHWAAANIEIAHLSIGALRIDPTMPAVLYAGTNGGVFKSVDSGNTWVPITSNWFTSSLLIDSARPSTLYAGSYGGQIFKSIDGGVNWSSAHAGLVDPRYTVLALALHNDGRTLLAGVEDRWWTGQCGDRGGCGGVLGGGVFKSTNGGNSWSLVNSGLSYEPVQTLAVDSSNSTLYAGTGSRVFKSTNGVLSRDSRLLNLVLTSGGNPVALSPAFDSAVSAYTATVQDTHNAGATLTPTAWIGDVSITVNGGTVTDGEATPIALDVGDNVVNVAITSGDGSSTRTYTVTVTRLGPPAAPSNVQAKPVGSSKVTVTWTAPTNTGGGITGYVVTAQPGGQTCTPTPPTATSCTVTGLTDGRTYTFTVEATNSAGSSSDSGTTPAQSNPATPLVNAQAFSAASPTGSGTLTATAAGGGSTCGFEYAQVLPEANVSVAPAAHLHFPHGVLDFVLTGCNQTDVTVTVNYPAPLPLGVQYWKLSGNTWTPYAGAVAQAGATTATLTLRDGGQGDDDGQANGRIVDPGQVAVVQEIRPGGTVAIPTLNQWALMVLAGMLLLVGWRRSLR
ncbi:IPTL-CTERM sorting domain-containing protein [Ottowia sp. VDI28]|uniref:IPTL-CTERM sorting domain-containing protein n=1 Tax=Ottowia sp. VDI28 TaxID=3133968 RepID=UPI003C2FCABE